MLTSQGDSYAQRVLIGDQDSLNIDFGNERTDVLSRGH